MKFPKFAKKEDIPKGFEESYEEKDGEWVPILEDTSGLKNSLTKARQERDAATRRAAEIEGKLTELESDKEAKAAGLTAEKLAEIQKKAEDKYKPQLERLQALEKENRELKLDGHVKGLFAKADMHDVDAAWKILGDEYDLTDDGKVILKSDPTADVSKHISGAVRQKYPYLFKGTQATGGGAGGQQQSDGAGGSGKPVTQWSSDEVRSYIEQHGPEAYQQKLNERTLELTTAKPAAA